MSMSKDLCAIISNAKLSDQEKLEALKVALAEGEDVNQLGAEGQYPLHLAFDTKGPTSIVRPSPLIIKFLLEQGANFSLEYLHYNKPIHRAVAEGWFDVIKILFEKKLYLFSWYAQEIHTEYSEDLVVNHPNACSYFLGESELTPLSVAIKNSKAEILDFILSHELVMQKEFNQHGLKVKPFLKQTYTCYLREGAELDDPFIEYDVYHLHLLAFCKIGSPAYFHVRKISLNEWTKTLRVLLKYGYNINQRTDDKYQDSLLHILCKNSTYNWNTLDAIKSAIKLGANPCQKNNQGKTPLITCHEDFAELTHFLYEQGYDLSRVWRPKNTLPKNFNIGTVLNYFPQYYVNVCHSAEISEFNLGGIINRTITEKIFESFPKIESYRLAFKASFVDSEKDNYYVNTLKKWSITHIEQLKTLDIPKEEWAQHLKVLAAYLITEPQYVDADLRKLLGQAFVVVIEIMLAKEKFEAQHLSTLKMVLENSTYVPKDLVSSITDYYLKLYQKYFTQLPSLKILALDSLLTHAHEFAKDTEIAPQEMSVIENNFNFSPIRTMKTKNGYYHLSFFCVHSSDTSGEENRNDSLSRSDDHSSACTGSKRSFSEIEDGESEEPSPKRYKI